MTINKVNEVIFNSGALTINETHALLVNLNESFTAIIRAVEANGVSDSEKVAHINSLIGIYADANEQILKRLVK
jgi:hypothetical protein